MQIVCTQNSRRILRKFDGFGGRILFLCKTRENLYTSGGVVGAVCELLRTEKGKSKQLQTKKLGGYIFYV